MLLSTRSVLESSYNEIRLGTIGRYMIFCGVLQALYEARCSHPDVISFEIRLLGSAGDRIAFKVLQSVLPSVIGAVIFG